MASIIAGTEQGLIMAETAEGHAESSHAAGIERVWLDWHRPLVRQAATWLLDRAAQQAESDTALLSLDRLACITPGRRAGRVLLEETLRQCEVRGRRMTPFRTLTPGSMVDALIERDPDTPARAMRFESELAWAHALMKQNEQILSKLITTLPQRDDRAGWLALARTIHSLHAELTGQRKTFAEVAGAVDRLGGETERERWDALAAIARDYQNGLTALSDGGLVDAELDREQLAASSDLPQSIELVLIGVTELNQVQRTLIARLHGRTTSLIHAPQAHRDGFDSHGCIVPEYWSQHVLEIDDEHLIVADQPGDQAQEVLRQLARLSAVGAQPSASDDDPRQDHSRPQAADSPLPVDHVTIGVEDAALADHLDLAAKWAGVQIHRAAGERLDRSAPYRLLSALADWLEEQRFAPFAAVLRHPDIERWLHEQFRHQQHDEIARSAGDWLTLLDTYFEEHLHEKLTGSWLGRAEASERLKSLHTVMTSLVQPLQSGAAKPLAEWAQPILTVLADVYAPEAEAKHEMDDRDRSDRAIDACLAVRDGLSDLAQVHPDLQPSVRAPEAVRLVLELVREQTLAMRPRDDQIESLGWLELHADLAPVLILMGVNDGTIPMNVTSDPFLPNTLRAQLGLVDNAHRYARDAYRLEAIQRSRDRLIIITGRRSEDGEPLPPSRLLLACGREQLPRRVRRLSDEHQAARYPTPIGMAEPAVASRFTIPRPPDEPPVIEKMSVTSFRLYLKCPYRFWLERVLKLKAHEDSAVELDSLSFGSFAHRVLQRFGEDSSIRDSDDADAIRAFLRDAAQREAKRSFGSSPQPAVRVQLDRLNRRLDAFAEQQARMTREGWRILHCELELPETVALDIPDQSPMRITGKIDRIDRHEVTGAYRIIDYKTGNNPTTPTEAHHGAKRKSDKWIDLQLPLYHALAQQIEIAGKVEVGYIVLPRDPDSCGYLPADWDDDELDAAIEEARRVVRDVRAGCFWQPANDFGRDDIYANICQSNVFDSDDFGSPAEGEGGGA